MRVLGLMSGTSMDGIDAAAVDVERKDRSLNFALRAFGSTPYPAEVRGALERVHSSNSSSCAAEISWLNFAVGEAFAAAAQQTMREVSDVALIGSHGQTVFHEPRPDSHSGRAASTLQIGEPAVIAARTGITTIADFRVADVAMGGQGAPLVSYVDYLTLRSPNEARAVLNIGGIANLTLLPAGCREDQVRAFDTGPGNMLIDLAARAGVADGPAFDRDGRMAERGAVHTGLLAWLLSHPYVSQASPKTAGREQFGPAFYEVVRAKAGEFGCDGNNLIATLTSFSARTIAEGVPSDCRLLVVAGGGVHNRTLVRALEKWLRDAGKRVRIVLSDDFGFPVDAKEAMAFAILAYEALHGRNTTLSSATGARRSSVTGKIAPGENFATLMRSVWS